jgi:hypothetical protein
MSLLVRAQVSDRKWGQLIGNEGPHTLKRALLGLHNDLGKPDEPFRYIECLLMLFELFVIRLSLFFSMVKASDIRLG